MALLKLKTHKGQGYEYWAWVLYGQNRIDSPVTTFAVGAFKDKATRDASIANEEPALREVRQYPGLLTLEQCYTKFKESNGAHLVFQNAIEEVLDEDGEVVTPAVPEVAEDRPNTNWFADAESI